VFQDAAKAAGWDLEQWLVPGGPPPDRIEAYDAVLVLGGAMHVDELTAHPWLDSERELLARLVDAGTPTLGVCLGAQQLAAASGAGVRRAGRPEIGWHTVELTPDGAADRLLGPLAPAFEAFQWHAYEFELPAGAVQLARSNVCLQAYRLGATAWGIQFHAEVSAADALAWVADTSKDPDAVAAAIDEAHLRLCTERSIEAWNETGRALFARFLELAATRA
jgi:GMP synthase (glutamine-hydrolysing)